MTKFFQKHITFIYFLVAFLEGMVATFFIIQLPSEAGQGILLGYSAQRLILVLGNLLIALFFLFLALYTWKNPQRSEEIKARLSERKVPFLLLFALNIAGALFMIFAFLVPDYRLASYAGYFERLHPTIVWFALIYLQTLFLFTLPRIKDFKFLDNEQVQSLRPLAIIFSLFLLIWAFITFSRIGITPDDRFWNEAGVPLLNGQIFIAILLTIIFFYISLCATNNAKLHSILAFFHKYQDLFIFLSLWLITAILWINEPLPRNFFAPGPYPPNNELSPYADPAAFDIGGQFALIGQGLFNGGFYNRPLLSAFLAFLHLVVGQNYHSVIALQTAIFASLVPILYLIGKELHSRTAGVLLAVLVIFKTLNAIASSTWILSAHTKYMLTEFATAITLALFTLWFIRWKKGGDNKSPLILAGGALGLGIMLRTNILFFFPLAIFLFFLKEKSNWKKLIQAALVFFLAFFVTISPWMWRSQKVANKPLFFLDIITEVIRTRYSLDVDELPASHVNLGMSAVNQHPVRRESSTLTLRPQTETFTSPLLFIPSHFFHNIVTSVYILPTSLEFHDLKHTINDIFPYWGKVDTETNLSEKTLLLWNLLLLALGITAAWRKWHVASLIPLLVFLIYHLSNAFARTSGGRYLVSVDWVILLYYALGIVEIISFMATFLGIDIKNTARKMPVEKSVFSYKKGFLFILPFFLFVASITILDQVPSPRYTELASAQIQQEILEGKYLRESGITIEEFSKFLEDPNARVFIGRSLYPRFYGIGSGEHSKGKDAFENKNFPRLTFTMIGQFGQTGAILPLAEVPVYFPNGVDIILIGCQHPTAGYLFPYVDAYMVVLLDDMEEIIYTREPVTTLQCPLPEPVCDGNRNCR